MMNNCQNCGKEFADGAKFCGECGNVLESSGGEEPSSVQTVSEPKQMSDQEKFISLTADYGAYFKRTLLSPSSSLQENESSNGLIQYLIIPLIQVIFFRILSSNMYISFPIRLYVLTYIYLFMLNFIPAFVVYLVKSFVYNSEDSFKKVITQYAGMHAVYVVLLISALFASLFYSGSSGTVEIVILSVMSLAIVSLISLFSVYLYSSGEGVRLDNLYVVLIGFIMVGILAYLWTVVFFEISGPTIERMFEEMYSYNYYW